METRNSKAEPESKDTESVLIELHQEKRCDRFNGIVLLHYHEGNLRKIKEEITTHNLSK